eukprot:SM000300S11724  [mRNA]  locus=s300:19943:21864:- [translate_table: standard]
MGSRGPRPAMAAALVALLCLAPAARAYSVVLPVPRPVGYSPGEPYKLSLQFGKERFVTPWLFVLGRKGPDIPVVDVTLAHFAGELRGVKAQVAPMPSKYLDLHPDIAQHYHNDSSWPKHILLRYTWKEQAEMDSKAGLYVLFGSAFAMTTTLALYILQSSKEKIARFMNEHVASTPVPGTEIAKVE